MPSNIERKKYLVSVFEDTLIQIERDPELQNAIKHSISNQIFIPSSDEINMHSPRFIKDAKIIVSQNRTFEAAANYREQKTAVLNFASPFFRISKFGSSEYQHLQCGKKIVLMQPLNVYLCRLNEHLTPEKSWKNLRIAGKCLPLQRNICYRNPCYVIISLVVNH